MGVIEMTLYGQIGGYVKEQARRRALKALVN